MAHHQALAGASKNAFQVKSNQLAIFIPSFYTFEWRWPYGSHADWTDCIGDGRVPRNWPRDCVNPCPRGRGSGWHRNPAKRRDVHWRRPSCARSCRLRRILDVNDVALNAFVEAIAQEFGGLHILVNNAGITQDQLMMRMKDEDWDAVINTNLNSVFRLSRAALRPMLKARYGRMMNITSVVGAAGNAGQANYAAAKAGVTGMTRALAREVGGRGIRVGRASCRERV